MLRPNMVRCYNELLEDASLLHLCPEEEGTSFQELPLLGVSTLD